VYVVNVVSVILTISQPIVALSTWLVDACGPPLVGLDRRKGTLQPLRLTELTFNIYIIITVINNQLEQLGLAATLILNSGG
jgi:hypothetical protein